MRYTWNPPTSEKDVIKKNLRGFFRFVFERQRIWHRRFVRELPRKNWTKDPILSKYKYTNVYRRIDRGTIWLLNNILFTKKLGSDSDRFALADIVWKVCMYRLLNKVETFEKVGIISYEGYTNPIIRSDFFDNLSIMLENGEKVWTDAHITLQCNLKQGRLNNYEMILDKLHSEIPEITKAVFSNNSIRLAFNKFLQNYGFGPFTSYEVVSDLAYLPWSGLDPDEWANAGPGCRLGINLIYPNIKTTKDYLAAMKKIRDMQLRMFKELYLPWKSVRFSNTNLNLRDVEHSLCEYGKYHRQRIGKGKSRSLFIPTK